jgi:iron-sulfur cluster assembly accessory protein
MTATDTLPPLTVAPGAAARIQEILAASPPGSFVRLAVNAGGCSGFAYEFGIDSVRNEDDHSFGDTGAGLVVDAASLELLAGSIVDFTDALAGAHFAVRNPNATSGCGCGTSFAI